MVLLEVCCETLDSVSQAVQGGAHRVELCSNLIEGGVTPSFGLIKSALEVLGHTCKLHVLVRPRGGDFIYSRDELNTMMEDISISSQLGAHGVVTGALNKEGSIDKMQCQLLLSRAQAKNLDFTFHRAFDMCCNLSGALNDLMDLGVPRLLTSGGCATASEGVDVIHRLVQQSAGRIIIMPGAGIAEGNVRELVQRTGVAEIHASARSLVPGHVQPGTRALCLGAANVIPDGWRMVTDAAKVAGIIAAASGTAKTQAAMGDVVVEHPQEQQLVDGGNRDRTEHGSMHGT